MNDDDEILDRTGEKPGSRPIDGTDLEISYNMRGSNLVLRVNKGGVCVFRVMLEDAAGTLTSEQLINFSTFAPDFVFKIGATRACMMQLAKSVGLDDEQMGKFEARLMSPRELD